MALYFTRESNGTKKIEEKEAIHIHKRKDVVILFRCVHTVKVWNWPNRERSSNSDEGFLPSLCIFSFL